MILLEYLRIKLIIFIKLEEFEQLVSIMATYEVTTFRTEQLFRL